MKRLMVRTGFVVLLLSTKSHAQSGATIPADGGHASQAGCVILKRMGRIDRSKTRWYSFGISGKQFRYVEGELPEGFFPSRKMTDHDVRNLQAQGAQVVVLESNYTPEDLKEAEAGCQGGTSRMPNQVEAKASPAPGSGVIADAPAPPPTKFPPKAPSANGPAPETSAPKTGDSASPAGTVEAALLDVSSSPTEADIYVDERLSGRTPSTLILMPGDHEMVIKKRGFVVWQRKFKLPSGRTNVDAELVPKAK